MRCHVGRSEFGNANVASSWLLWHLFKYLTIVFISPLLPRHTSSLPYLVLPPKWWNCSIKTKLSSSTLTSATWKKLCLLSQRTWNERRNTVITSLWYYISLQFVPMIRISIIYMAMTHEMRLGTHGKPVNLYSVPLCTHGCKLEGDEASKRRKVWLIEISHWKSF